MRRLGTVLLFLLIALCFAPTLVPPFLDRIYYRGPVSDHYDGAHFFNPADGPDGGAHGPAPRFLTRLATGGGAKWPKSVPVTPTVPPRRVEGRRMLVTWIGHATVL